MPKHLSQQRKRHIERQQAKEWWEIGRTKDVRTMSLDEINEIKDKNLRRAIKLWRKLHELGQ